MARSAPIRIFKSHLKATTFISDFGGFMGRRVINKTGSDIAIDKLVAISGYDVTSKLPKVVLADADSLGLATDVFVTTRAITNGNKGSVYKGTTSVANLNTNFGTVGDPVYLDTTAGAFTGTAPTALNARQLIVGYTMVKSATVGQIRWDIKSPSLIGSLDFQNGADTGQLLTLTGSISAANIVGTSAGQLGHANGVILVPAGGTHVVNQLVYLFIRNNFAVAAYTGGGNTTVNIGGGGAALTGLVSNANFIQSAADKAIEFVPLAATFNTYTENNSINFVTASAPTQPGTAAGVFDWTVGYRVLNTGF